MSKVTPVGSIVLCYNTCTQLFLTSIGLQSLVNTNVYNNKANEQALHFTAQDTSSGLCVTNVKTSTPSNPLMTEYVLINYI